MPYGYEVIAKTDFVFYSAIVANNADDAQQNFYQDNGYKQRAIK